LKETKVRSWFEDEIGNGWGNSHSGSGAGERAKVKALTERAPTARKVRAALENMMIMECREEQISTAPGLKFGR